MVFGDFERIALIPIYAESILSAICVEYSSHHWYSAARDEIGKICFRVMKQIWIELSDFQTLTRNSLECYGSFQKETDRA